MIPDQVLVTGKPSTIEEMPEEAQKNVRFIAKVNRGMRMRYMGDAECKKYIQDNFEKELEVAFDRAERGAYRGDICRAAVLFLEGGFYVDVDLQLRVALRDLVDNHTSFMSVISAYGGVMNALVGTEPESKVIRRTLEEVQSWYTVKEQILALEKEMGEDLEGLGHGDPEEYIPKTVVPMGPVTMLRGLQKALSEDCPWERTFLKGCGEDGNTPSKSTWEYCVPGESIGCSRHPSVKLYGEALINCEAEVDNRSDPDAELQECPRSRRGKAQSHWPTQFGIFQKDGSRTKLRSRQLIGWSHLVDCQEFGCGSNGAEAKPESQEKAKRLDRGSEKFQRASAKLQKALTKQENEQEEQKVYTLEDQLNSMQGILDAFNPNPEHHTEFGTSSLDPAQVIRARMNTPEHAPRHVPRHRRAPAR